MASKLARQITMLLLGNDYIYTFRSHKVMEKIDSVLKGKTISAKEIARLQEGEQILASAIDANNDLLRTKAYQRSIILGLENEIQKQRENSRALQEKLTISTQNESQLRNEITSLRLDNLVLQNIGHLFYIANKIQPDPEPEQIIPPPCLKPLDAMRWNESVVTGSITYRG